MSKFRDILAGIFLTDGDKFDVDFSASPEEERNDPRILVPTALNEMNFPDSIIRKNQFRNSWNRVRSLPFVTFPSELAIRDLQGKIFVKDVPVASAFRWNWGKDIEKSPSIMSAMMGVKTLDESKFTKKDLDKLIEIASGFLYDEFLSKINPKPELVLYPATAYSRQGRGSSGNPQFLDKMIDCFMGMYGSNNVRPYCSDIPKSSFVDLELYLKNLYPDNISDPKMLSMRKYVLDWLRKLKMKAHANGTDPYFQLKQVPPAHRGMFSGFMDLGGVNDKALDIIFDTGCSVVIIDDIWVGGNTLRDIVLQLREYDPKSISCCTIWNKSKAAPSDQWAIEYAEKEGFIELSPQEDRVFGLIQN